MPADASFRPQSDASRARLRAMIARLDDAQVGNALGHGGTVSAALAPLAWWGRRTLLSPRDWRRDGPRASASPGDADAINERERPAWLATRAEAAASNALGSAELIDREIASLPEVLVEAIPAAGRIRPLDRPSHRDEHMTRSIWR